MSIVKVLALAGSTRKGSFNQLLAEIAAKAAEDAGGIVTRLNLADFPLPIFDQDLEQASPPDALNELRQIFVQQDALLIASPEYNSSISPLLKNTIDWVSRGSDDLQPCAAYQGKVAGIMAASPGGLGGLRGLVHLRSILQNIGVMVVPDQVAIPQAMAAFGPDGSLNDQKQQQIVARISQAVVDIAGKLS